MNRLLPMINAEFLKLRKRRGLFWFTLLLSVGSVIIANAIIVAYHAADPVKYAPAGGLAGFTNMLTLFTITGGLAAVLVGATAGAQDVESGVFRSLVSTGQSRIRIALVRIPGALLMVLPMLAAGFGLEVIATFAFAQGTPTPDASFLLVGFGWLMAMAVLNVTVTLGLAALLGARGTAIGVMIAWELAGSRIIERITPFGGWRSLVSSVSLDRFLPYSTDTVALTRVDSITVTIGMAIAVVVGWIVISSALGVWRTATQDA
jgi:ABC-type transport system involved in multi-copper enzyme maturation permease subunit